MHQTRGADFYASLRTQTALEKAEVAVVLIDAEQTIAEQDIRVVQQVIDAGRALVVAYNKWDMLDEERRYYLEREIERELVQIPWAPRVNISAKTGRAVEKLVPAIESALESWDNRVPTGRLNAFFGEIVAAHPHPVRGGKQPRILFATQASTRPTAVRHLRLRASSRRATAASSSAASARSSASRARRSRCRSGSARSGAASRRRCTAYRFQAPVCRALGFRSLPRVPWGTTE